MMRFLSNREVGIEMDELIKVVSARTGLPPETAKQAAEAVLGFLKDKLPEPIASQLEGLIGGGDASNLLGGLPGGLGDMLGGKR
jgi:hypothetical protein